MTILTRPIGQWPGFETPAHKRRRSQFATSFSAIMKLLERELWHLGGRNAVIEIDCRPQDFRLDGGLRANARPQGPRVIVSCDTRHGPMRLPCDTFTKHEDNLYAIALTLEKLRAIDRYGVTVKGEQYRGFTAIPATTSVTTKVNAAWDLLYSTVGKARGGVEMIRQEDDYLDRNEANSLYREAAMYAHPDAGGSDELMAAVNRARETILSSLAGDE